MLVTPFDWLAVGITGKNLNFPAFRLHSGGNLVVDPAVRAGAAFFPLKWLTLAVDGDLYQNTTSVFPGYRSQVVGGGAEVDLGVVALRLGLSKNVPDPDETVVLHAGVAFRIWRISLELAGMCTPELQSIESAGVEVPERAGLSLTFGANIDF